MGEYHTVPLVKKSISILTSNYYTKHIIIKWKQWLCLNHILTTFSLQVSRKPTVRAGLESIHDHKLPFPLSCLLNSLYCQTILQVTCGDLILSICTDPETWVQPKVVFSRRWGLGFTVHLNSALYQTFPTTSNSLWDPAAKVQGSGWVYSCRRHCPLWF